MSITCILGTLLFLRQSRVKTLESDLRSAVKNVAFNSMELNAVVDRVAAKYQKGFSQHRGVTKYQNCFGPTPIRIADIGLENDKYNVDGSYDEANICLWPTKTGTAVQLLDALSESGAEERNYLVGESYRDGDRLIRCGAAFGERSRSWPCARIYRLQDGRWRVVAEEGSEDPYGYAEFQRSNGRILPETMVSHTRDEPMNFSPPLGGPFLSFSQTWYIRKDRFITGEVKLVQNALAELDRLAGLAKGGHRKAFDVSVSPSISQKLWNLLRGWFHVSSASGQGEGGNVFRLEHPMDKSGEKSIVGTVTFALRSGKWRAVDLTDK